MRIDTHIHTSLFSADAVMTYDDLLDHCRKYPATMICCTEHYDHDYPGDGTALIFDPSEYAHGFERLKLSYESGSPEAVFPVLYGAEIGFIEHLSSYYDEFAAASASDSIVGSVHTIGRYDPYVDKIYVEQSKSDA